MDTTEDAPSKPLPSKFIKQIRSQQGLVSVEEEPDHVKAVAKRDAARKAARAAAGPGLPTAPANTPRHEQPLQPFREATRIETAIKVTAAADQAANEPVPKRIAYNSDPNHLKPVRELRDCLETDGVACTCPKCSELRQSYSDECDCSQCTWYRDDVRAITAKATSEKKPSQADASQQPAQTGQRHKRAHPGGIEPEVKSSEPKRKRARGPTLQSATPDAEDQERNVGKDEKKAPPAPSPAPPQRQWQLIGRVESSHLIETVKHSDLIEFVRRHSNTFPCEVLTGAVVPFGELDLYVRDRAELDAKFPAECDRLFNTWQSEFPRGRVLMLDSSGMKQDKKNADNKATISLAVLVRGAGFYRQCADVPLLDGMDHTVINQIAGTRQNMRLIGGSKPVSAINTELRHKCALERDATGRWQRVTFEQLVARGTDLSQYLIQNIEGETHVLEPDVRSYSHSHSPGRDRKTNARKAKTTQRETYVPTRTKSDDMLFTDFPDQLRALLDLIVQAKHESGTKGDAYKWWLKLMQSSQRLGFPADVVRAWCAKSKQGQGGEHEKGFHRTWDSDARNGKLAALTWSALGWLRKQAKHDQPDAYKTWSRNFEVAKAQRPMHNDERPGERKDAGERVEMQDEPDAVPDETSAPDPLQVYRQYNDRRGETDGSKRAHQDSYHFVRVDSVTNLDELKQRLRTLQHLQQGDYPTLICGRRLDVYVRWSQKQTADAFYKRTGLDSATAQVYGIGAQHFHDSDVGRMVDARARPESDVWYHGECRLQKVKDKTERQAVERQLEGPTSSVYLKLAKLVQDRRITNMQEALGHLDPDIRKLAWRTPHAIEKALKYANETLPPKRTVADEKRLVVDVQCYVGAAGTGKTTMAYRWLLDEPIEGVPGRSQTIEECIRLAGDKVFFYGATSEGKWWDGYRSQKLILIDEADRHMREEILIDILNVGPRSVPIKGGTLTFYGVKFALTSNKKPPYWYTVDGDMSSAPLVRRLTCNGKRPVLRVLGRIPGIDVEYKEEEYKHPKPT